MKRRPLTTLAAAASVAVGVLVFANPAPVEAQCLNRTGCREIKAEISALKPDLRAARQKLRQLQRELQGLPRGSERWLAKRKQVKRAKKAFRKVKREHHALKLDFRHQGCGSC